MTRLISSAIIALALSGCAVDTSFDDETGDEATSSESALQGNLKPGVNGGACYLSPYNCKLRVAGGNRIEHADGTLDWGVDPNVDVLDGNGSVLGPNKSSTLKFNYGQKRTLGGKEYLFAMTTSNHSAGWFPLASVKSKDVLATRIGDAGAHRSGLEPMACYEIRNATDPALEVKKVVYDTLSNPGPAGEAAGDYLPRLRTNGKRSAHLIVNVPGSGLGGPAIDHFPAGTLFRRLRVPTDAGPPSLDVKLWAQDGAGNFKKAAGTMKFVYGYVASQGGNTRVGWIAYEALRTSSGCP